MTAAAMCLWCKESGKSRLVYTHLAISVVYKEQAACGPSYCATRPAAAFLNYLWYKNLTIIEAVRYTTYCDFYTCGPANQATIMVLVFCQTTLGTLVLIFL